MSGQRKKGQTYSELLSVFEQAIHAFQAGPKVEFEPDLRWKEVERMFDILDKLIEKEKVNDCLDDEGDREWFNPVLCEEKATRFMKWLQIDNNPDTRTISMVVNESKSRYELWLNPNRASTPNEILLFSVPAGTFMTEKDAAKEFELPTTTNDTSSALMVMFLMLQKYVYREHSTWKPFIDVLPSMRYTNSTSVFLTREDLGFLKSYRSLYCRTLDNLMNLWLNYIVTRNSITQGRETNIFAKAMGMIFTYKRYLWARSVVAMNTFNLARIGINGNGKMTGITTRLIPYNNDSNRRQPIFLHSTMDDPCFKFGLIPFMDMCPARDGEQFQEGANAQDLLMQLGPALGGSENPFPVTKSGMRPADYFYGDDDDDISKPGLDEGTYNLNLNLVKNKTFNRRQAALHAHGLTSQETFKLAPKFFLNRTAKNEDEILIYKKLFTFVHIYMAENELLDRIERSTEGDDLEFLTVPSKEAWAFLAERFDLLHKLAEGSLKRMANLPKTSDSSLTNSREKICLQYMEKERNCLARFTEIVTNRRDNDPKDELPSSLNPDEDLAKLSEEEKAAILSFKELHLPGSLRVRHVPTPGTQDDATIKVTYCLNSGK